MKFYSPSEKSAVEQVAAKLSDGDFNGWSSFQILNPSRFLKVNIDAGSPLALRAPGRASFERASVPETFLEFRHLLKNFPPFLALQSWEKLYESIPFTSWMGEAASAAKEFGLTHRFGTYCWNRFIDGSRVTDDVGVVKLTCHNTGIYADILHSGQTDPDALTLCREPNAQLVMVSDRLSPCLDAYPATPTGSYKYFWNQRNISPISPT